jgi:hypothetical protein
MQVEVVVGKLDSSYHVISEWEVCLGFLGFDSFSRVGLKSLRSRRMVLYARSTMGWLVVRLRLRCTINSLGAI